MTTTATAKREAATQPPQPQQPQQRSPGFLASIHQPILSPRSTNPPTNTTPAVDKSNNEDNFLLTPRPLTGIDYEEGQDGRKGVVGNDHGTNDGTDDDDDDVSSIAMSVSVSDVSSQMEMEDEYFEKYGHLLPSELVEGRAGRLRGAFHKVLEAHTRLIQWLRRTGRDL